MVVDFAGDVKRRRWICAILIAIAAGGIVRSLVMEEPMVNEAGGQR